MWGTTYDPGVGDRNQILQKSILQYIGEIKGLKYSDSLISLSFSKSKDIKLLHGDSIEQLSHFKIQTLPIEDEFVPITNEIEFLYTTFDQQEELKRSGRGRGGKGLGKKKDNEDHPANKMIISYYFRSKGKNGEQIIKDFVQVLSFSTSISTSI